MPRLLYILLVVLLCGCGGGEEIASDTKTDESESQLFDTLTISGDSIYEKSRYLIKLISPKKVNQYSTKINSLFVFQLGSKEIVRDSIYSRVGKIEFVDYNQDGTKDVLIQNISDVRSNWTYYLYLVDLENEKLNKVVGFEEIKNPEFNSEIGVIESHVVSGRNYAQVYKIIEDNRIYKYDTVIYDKDDEEGYRNFKKYLETLREEN